MNKSLLAVALCLSCGMTQAEDWFRVAWNKNIEIHIKPGSFATTKTRDGTVVYRVAGKMTVLSNDDITVNQWYVSQVDCLSGYGSLVTLDMSGTIRYQTDYLDGDGTVGGRLATAICTAGISKNKPTGT